MSEPQRGFREALAGRYVVDREIGHGGMPTVFLAHDRRHDRAVALKVLAPELPTSGARSILRFSLREGPGADPLRADPRYDALLARGRDLT